MRVGSCQANGVSAVTPRPISPAATRSLQSRNSPKVTVRSCSSINIAASGERSARRASSSHSVDASSITSVTSPTVGAPWLVRVTRLRDARPSVDSRHADQSEHRRHRRRGPGRATADPGQRGVARTRRVDRATGGVLWVPGWRLQPGLLQLRHARRDRRRRSRMAHDARVGVRGLRPPCRRRERHTVGPDLPHLRAGRRREPRHGDRGDAPARGRSDRRRLSCGPGRGEARDRAINGRLLHHRPAGPARHLRRHRDPRLFGHTHRALDATGYSRRRRRVRAAGIVRRRDRTHRSGRADAAVRARRPLRSPRHRSRIPLRRRPPRHRGGRPDRLPDAQRPRARMGQRHDAAVPRSPCSRPAWSHPRRRWSTCQCWLRSANATSYPTHAPNHARISDRPTSPSPFARACHTCTTSRRAASSSGSVSTLGGTESRLRASRSAAPSMRC